MIRSNFMRSKFLVLVCTLNMLLIQMNDVSSEGRRATDFPYCYINGNVIHFGKLLKDPETCTIQKCKKGKKPIVETYKCADLDSAGMYGEYVSWCMDNNCDIKS